MLEGLTIEIKILKLCKRLAIIAFSGVKQGVKLLGLLFAMLSADNLCKQFGPRSGPTKFLA